MKKVAMLITLLCLTGCIFMENVEREGFSEDDLKAPSPYTILLQKKPTANFPLPFSYSYNISWQISELYEYYRGAIKIEIENTGKNEMFVYGFGIKIGGEEQKEDWGGGKKISPNEKQSFIFSFKCPAAGEYEYEIGI